jgi:hypothetical protein
MAKEPAKILFIVGVGRSGSTLIDQVLGEIPGFWSTGELHTVWTHGLLEGDSCGCGVPVPECGFWREVLTRAIGGSQTTRATQLADIMDSHIRTRPLQLLRLSRGIRRGRPNVLVRQYATVLRRIYGAMQAATGCKVIVDSTKVPSHALVAATLTDMEVYVLHLVRDPRGVAYSWVRNPDAGGRKTRSGPPTRGLRLLESVMQWSFRSFVIEILVRRRWFGHYTQLRYEDFAANPRDATSAVCEFLGMDDPPPSSFRDARTITVGANHILSGNRSKFRRGQITISADDDWKHALSPGSRWTCVLLTAPLMRRYKYPILRTAPPSPSYA